MKLKFIDSIRGFAILLVMMVHCYQAGPKGCYPILLERIFENGGRGVQLFFLASAFTLFLSMDQRTKHEHRPVRNYFIRRFFRIAPMYYLGIFYYLWQDGIGPRYWLGDAEKITWANIVSNFLFLHGFNPYWITSLVPGGWSIAVEMLFYCFLPFLYQKIGSVRQAFNFFVISVIIRFTVLLFMAQFPLIPFQRLWEEFMFLFFPSQLPVFALGIMAYRCTQERMIQGLNSTFLLLMAFLLTFYTLGYNNIFPYYIIFSLAFFFFFLALYFKEMKIFVNIVTIYIGKVSYSLYLVHFAVLYWMGKWELLNFFPFFGNLDCLSAFGVRFMVFGLISVAFATLTYQFIEKPGQNIGKKLIQYLENQQTIK